MVSWTSSRWSHTFHAIPHSIWKKTPTGCSHSRSFLLRYPCKARPSQLPSCLCSSLESTASAKPKHLFQAHQRLRHSHKALDEVHLVAAPTLRSVLAACYLDSQSDPPAHPQSSTTDARGFEDQKQVIESADVRSFCHVCGGPNHTSQTMSKHAPINGTKTSKTQGFLSFLAFM